MKNPLDPSQSPPPKPKPTPQVVGTQDGVKIVIPNLFANEDVEDSSQSKQREELKLNEQESFEKKDFSNPYIALVSKLKGKAEGSNTSSAQHSPLKDEGNSQGMEIKS